MKNASIFLVVVFVTATILPVFGVTKDELAKMFFLADNPESGLCNLFSVNFLFGCK